MKHGQRSTLVFLGLGTLLFAGCGPASESGAPAQTSTQGASNAHAETPKSEAPAHAADAHAGEAGEAEVAAVKPGSDPANARNAPARYEGGIDQLESGYDLSKVKVDDKTAEADPHAGHDHGDEHNEKPGEQILNPATSKGRITMVGGEQTHDFGKLRQGEAARHDFIMVSDGEEPLVISGVKPSCGCTKAEVQLVADDGSPLPYAKTDPIAKGTRFMIQAEINTEGRQGPFSAQISVYSNDARGPFTLRLAAEVEPVLTVEPSPTVFFGKITTAQTVEQTVTVAATQGEHFRLTPAQDTLPEPVQVEYTAKFPDAEGKSSEWDVKVTLGPNAEIGMKSYPLNFKSDLVIANPKYPSPDGSPQFHAVMINVQAQVTGMVSAEPSFLTFGMVRPGEAVERALRIESHDTFLLSADMPVVFEGLQGQDFPYKDRFKVTVEPVEGGKFADVKVKLEGFPEELNGSFGGQIKLKVGHPFMDELLVRFSGVCRPGLPAASTTPAAPPTPQVKPIGGGN